MEMWDTQKADLRKQMRGLLKAVSAEEKTAWDREVCRRVLSRPEIAGADRILGYMALSWETGTRKLLEILLREGKRVALPRVVMDGKNSQEKGPWMDFFEIRSMDDLEEGAFRILEPGGHCPKATGWTAPVLVPAWPLRRTEGGWEREVAIMTASWNGSRTMRPWPLPMASRWWKRFRAKSTTGRWIWS